MTYQDLTKKDDYLEALETRNQERADEDVPLIEFAADDNNDELISKLEADDIERNRNGDQKEPDSKKVVKSNKSGFFYLVKDQAYVDDTKLLTSGLYCFDDKQERLEGQEPYVLSYGKKMSEMQIAEAGGYLGITVNAGDDTDFAELQAKLLRDETNYRYE
jgi:hypothetical protein